MKTVMFNPYTGTPRHPSDIASDPEGLLIVEPGAPLRAARPKRDEAARLQDALRRVQRTTALPTAHEIARLALHGIS